MKKRGIHLTPTYLPPAEEAELRRALESVGWRYTRQRAAVYNWLRSVHDHPTAEDVYSAVRQEIPNISLATVYKSLEALVACKLAAKLSLGDGPARYDCRTDHHFHIRCLKTGRVRDLDIPQVGDLIAKLDPHLVESLKEQGFQVTDYRLELLGYFDEANGDSPEPQPSAN
jgi:Fe2+ or Zn2+ uptake regulation protein